MNGDFGAALQSALKLLRTRERFESEVRSRLSQFPEDVVDEVVCHLKRRNLLSETRAAESLARRREGYGRARLESELAVKGAPDSVIATAMPDEDIEIAQAVRVLAKKYPAGGDRARAGRFLASRGFDSDAIETALDRHFSEEA